MSSSDRGPCGENQPGEQKKQMKQRQISVSTVAYDGYPFTVSFPELERLGVKLVEPAYINGYMVFAEDDFEAPAIGAMTAILRKHGLSCLAISAHMDIGAADAEAMLARRIRFTAEIGARYTITNATTHDRRQLLLKTLEANLRLAEKLGVVIALENPGHGNTNIMMDAERGAELVRSFNSPFLCMNYDTSNALTCTEGATRPESDIDFALPVSGHMHLKDVIRAEDRWRYTAIGAGEIDYAKLLAKLKTRPDMPLTLELPLRLRRKFHQDPEREPELTSLPSIAHAIKDSWNCCARAFCDLEMM
jgi:sugar phosphate isomerase/epimerase